MRLHGKGQPNMWGLLANFWNILLYMRSDTSAAASLEHSSRDFKDEETDSNTAMEQFTSDSNWDLEKYLKVIT
jgi:hypothetical protein